MNWSTAIKSFPSYLNLFLINKIYYYFYFSILAADIGGNQHAIAIDLPLQPNSNQLAIAIHLQPICNQFAIAIHQQSTGNCDTLAIAIHWQSTASCNTLAIHCHLKYNCNPLAMATHWRANSNSKSNAAHHVPAHTMHIAMNWSTDVTGMQVLNNFHRCYRCDVMLHLQGNCNYACDAICDILQVRSACNTSQRSMCICSRALSTLWIVASSVCILHPSPATPHPAWK